MAWLSKAWEIRRPIDEVEIARFPLLVDIFIEPDTKE